MGSTDGPTSWRRAIGTAAGITLAVSVLVLAFLWPTVTSTVRDVPVVVAGQGAEQVAAMLEQSAGDRFELSTVADRDAAADLVQQREVYGAIVVGAEPEVLVASAASPAVAQLLTALAPQLEAQLQATAPGATVAVTNLVPYAESDPNGAGLAGAGFPLLMGGMLGGIGIALAVSGRSRQVAALLVYSVVGGVLVTTVLQAWLGVLQGGFLPNAGAFALTFAAMGAPILGAVRLLGRRGVALGPVVFMLFANPIASVATPPQLLPGAWGAIGQAFPPGASSALLRTVSYFPEASTAQPVLVLSLWAVAGLALALLAPQRRPATEVPASEPVPAADAVQV